MGSKIMAAANSVFADKQVSISSRFGTPAKPATAGLALTRAGLPLRADDTATWLKCALVDVKAPLDEDDVSDRVVKPIPLSTGEAAIAVGWSHIDDLEASAASINTALGALKSNSVEIARRHFGDGIAKRVRRRQETALDAAKYWLDYRISSISCAFGISGRLVELDDSGQLLLGWFMLTYDGGHFRATVDTNQHAIVTQNGAAWQVSVRQVTADLASGKLPL